MHIKVKNLVGMWAEEGYTLRHYEEFMDGSKLAELKIGISRVDKEDVIFLEEWDTLKRLASRQQFFIIPTKPVKEGIAELYLISKDKITQMVNQFLPIKKKLSYSYWGIQGDEEINSLVESTTIMRMALVRVQTDIQRFATMTENHYLSDIFDNPQTLDNWETYKKFVKVWSQKINLSEKISNDLKNDVSLIADTYNY